MSLRQPMYVRSCRDTSKHHRCVPCCHITAFDASFLIVSVRSKAHHSLI